MSSYLLYQLKSSQLTPSSWYSLSVLLFLYSLDSSNFFQELEDGRVWTERRREGSKKQRGKKIHPLQLGCSIASAESPATTWDITALPTSDASFIIFFK